jgi:hypothetical protein
MYYDAYELDHAIYATKFSREVLFSKKLRIWIWFLFCPRTFQPANALSLDPHPCFAGRVDAVCTTDALRRKRGNFRERQFASPAHFQHIWEIG